MSTGEKEKDKASRYIDQLYEARCNGEWRLVPELCRKVEKHEPSRKCLTLAARAGAFVNADSSTSSFTAAKTEYNSALTAAISQDNHSDQDLFDAIVAQAMILAGCAHWQQALDLLPTPLHLYPAPTSGLGKEAWAASCVVQGTLIRGLAFTFLDKSEKATDTYRSFISDLARVVILPSLCPTLLRTTEELMVQMCLHFSKSDQGKPAHLGEAMATFHLLSQFMSSHKATSLHTHGLFTKHPPRQVWGAYYQALSTVIAEDLVYHPSPIDRDHDTIEHRGLLDDDEYFASRVQQRKVARIVEANYESLLLKDTKFPKAGQSNDEVKNWVELAMSNWRVFCGPSWSDEELGMDGKIGVGRATLDILYRAATKTFNSTQILRHLFTIHVYLGEFDLAFKAFDSFAEIVTKEKTRSEKPGAPRPALDDDDDTIVKLAAEASRVICRYGYDETGEKALQISTLLHKWLASGSANESYRLPNNQADFEANHFHHHEKNSDLSAETISVAYRAIGISQAQAARKAHSPTHRSDLRKKAVLNLQSSLNQGLQDDKCTETLYSLALVHAELRELPKALEYIKRALTNTEETRVLVNPDGVLAKSIAVGSAATAANSAAARKKIFPAWHLLTLLLSARESFEVGLETCSAAFDQFNELMDELGYNAKLRPAGVDGSGFSSSRAEKRLSGIKAKHNPNLLENFEKQSMLELKMTQLSILEIIEGPETAVNASKELLALYARLFGTLESSKNSKPVTQPLQTPPTVLLKSSSGTVRSRRPKSERNKLNRSTWASSSMTSAHTSRPTTAVPDPPIHITTENGIITDDQNGENLERQHTATSDHKRESGSFRKRAFGSLRHRKSLPSSRPSTGRSTARTSARNSQRGSLDMVRESTDTQQVQNGLPSLSIRTKDNNEKIREKSPTPILEDAPLPPISHNIKHDKLAPPPGHISEPARQDIRLPVPHPKESLTSIPPQFLRLQDQRYQVTLLVKIWLFTAALYTKAALFDDASGAIDEASHLVDRLELEATQEHSNIRSYQEQSWGGGHSVEKLRADVQAERGILYKRRSLPHDARECFEQALLNMPDHPTATVELSTILLDIYCRIIPAEKSNTTIDPLVLLTNGQESLETSHIPRSNGNTKSNDSRTGDLGKPVSSTRKPELSPPELYRIAARDRAHGLLSSLTKLGTGWDHSEAWFALARAYEESGQLTKAKEALWWTVELEDTKPVRHWREVGPGGYVL